MNSLKPLWALLLEGALTSHILVNVKSYDKTTSITEPFSIAEIISLESSTAPPIMADELLYIQASVFAAIVPTGWEVTDHQFQLLLQLIILITVILRLVTAYLNFQANRPK